MEYIMLYRKMRKLGISAESVDSLAQSYKKWLVNPRPIIDPYGLVYYVDGTLCSMPFQIKEPLIKPAGIEINGVFYLNRCLNIEENSSFPDWDNQFVFDGYPKVTETDISHSLRLLKKQVLLEFVGWNEGEPDFKLELPTEDEILTLSEVLGSNNCYIKNLFSDGENYWLQSSGKRPKVSSIYAPYVNRKSHSYTVTPIKKDTTAIVLPVVHKGANTFIGHLDEFEVPDAATTEMYRKLTESASKK